MPHICLYGLSASFFVLIQKLDRFVEVELMEFVTQNLLWIAIALISGVALIYPALRSANTKSVTPAQAVMLINRQHAVLVDVRDAAEHAAMRIASAQLIPLGELAGRVQDLNKYKSRPVVLLCASGSRSLKGVEILSKAGFEQVFNLDGGIKAWKDAGLPVTSEKKA
jgi:rhodanese-related sulfurtransferase